MTVAPTDTVVSYEQFLERRARRSRLAAEFARSEERRTFDVESVPVPTPAPADPPTATTASPDTHRPEYAVSQEQRLT